jgi:hypothetical protein
MGLSCAALQWLLFGFQGTGSLDIRLFVYGRMHTRVPVCPVKKVCVLLLIQALHAYMQIKFQSYYCLLIIARDFGTLFLKAFFANESRSLDDGYLRYVRVQLSLAFPKIRMQPPLQSL